MLKKIIYSISILSLFFLTFLVVEMLPFLFHTGFSGILFLIIICMLLVLELILFLQDKEFFKNAWSFHLFFILATMYLGIISYLIYYTQLSEFSISLHDHFSYYSKNYYFLSLVFLFIIIHFICLRKEKDG